MFESTVENYIGKVLVEEANSDGNFLTDSEIAFRVTGMMYADKIKSDGPVSLRSVKGKMGKVRNLCDEKSILMIPNLQKKEGELQKDENPYETIGWKIATGNDLEYIGQKYLGLTPDTVSDTPSKPKEDV